MKKPRAKRTLHDLVRETFTPSRVGLLSWAFAAMIMGTIGLASYQFGPPPLTLDFSGEITGGLPLPPAGPVESTASVRTSAGYPVGIMQMPRNGGDSQAARLNQEQIEVLQREIVALRRRLSALSEQNTAYSHRIAALEKEVGATRLAAVEKSLEPGMSAGPLEPEPGVISFEAAPATLRKEPETEAPIAAVPVPKKPLTSGTAAATGGTPSVNTPEAQAFPNVPARIVSIYNERKAQQAAAVPSGPDTAGPVRIVTLPDASNPPAATGSIAPRSPEGTPDLFDATPTRSAPKPTIVTSSDPSGRISGGGQSKLKRSDFGAVIGRYPTAADATAAWAEFKEQNQERMGDLHPLILTRDVAEGGVSLMVGPFANAADAAVACLQLLDVTEFCQPALFAGEPLVTTAGFPDSAL